MPLQIQETPKQLIKRKKVESLTSLSRSSIYRLMAEDSFPRPVRLGSKSVSWVLADVEEWINTHIAASKGVQP
ncbi:helix-turn-helix transcriptional regulator [Sulfuriferula nivalis]|uniref:Transcriptional regulator n=1 Tax=Sulfuriferula nivalis TaxID=2675298 RepID=A0A809S9R6_9PROT|nr:AlpA family transcriptional regulator [Sulfuriferula nivalis]BBP01463.1 transcriptional regulator [Sulfuriferula nivalis]